MQLFAIRSTQAFPRLFAAIGAVFIVLVCAIDALLEWENFTRTMLIQSEQNNQLIARSVQIGVAHQTDILLGAAPARGGEAAAAVHAIERFLAQNSRGTGLLKIKIFDRDGTIVYAIDAKEIGASSYRSAGLRRALAGTSATVSEFRRTITTISGLAENRHIVQSYLPVRADMGRGELIGVFEVYLDVSPLVGLMRTNLVLRSVQLLALLFAFYLGLLLLLVHIHRRLRAVENERIELAAEAGRADAFADAKSQFMMNVSHEFRTPLNAILGFAEMLRSPSLPSHDTARVRRYAADIHDSGAHLLRLVEEVVAMGEIEQGLRRIPEHGLTTLEVMQDVHDAYRKQAQARDISVVPMADATTPVAAVDAARLRQILLNLVGLAVSSTPAGGRVDLTARGADGGRFVEYSVRDVGSGMSHAAIANLLKLGGKAENPWTTHNFRLGLRLPLAKQMTESLGGVFSIESERGGAVQATLRFSAAKFLPALVVPLPAERETRLA